MTLKTLRERCAERAVEYQFTSAEWDRMIAEQFEEVRREVAARRLRYHDDENHDPGDEDRS